MQIQLDEQEIIRAAGIATLRNTSQRSASRPDGKVIESSYEADRIGAEGELAVSKALDLPWDGSWLPIPIWDHWKHDGNDVGKIEVRTTGYETGRLILHQSDKNDSPYLLVIAAKKPIYRLAGWMWGREGKLEKYWAVHVPRPCYMVRQDELRSVESLVELLRQQ